MYKPGYATVGNFLEPRITSEDEVKIRVHYCAINSDDYSMYMGKLKFLWGTRSAGPCFPPAACALCAAATGRTSVSN